MTDIVALGLQILRVQENRRFFRGFEAKEGSDVSPDQFSPAP